MLSIYLCEDDEKQLREWETLLRKHLFISNLSAETLFAAQTPEALLEEITRQPPIMGLYYLDVDLNSQLNGFELAERIRQIDPRSFLVFVTMHSELSHMPFEKRLEAMDYVLKGPREEMARKMTACLHSALGHYSHLGRYPISPGQLVLKIQKEYLFLPYQDIILLETETRTHRIRFHLREGEVSKHGSLTDFRRELDRNLFCQISQSAIVNLLWVDRVDTGEKLLFLKNGLAVSYSFRYQRAMFTMLERYGIR